MLGPLVSDLIPKDAPVLMCLCGLMATPVAAADPIVMLASNGAELSMPDIGHMTCDEMQITLLEISDSGYRGTLPVAPDHPDHPIFVYEDTLAKMHFQDCQTGGSDFASPQSVFSSGFN